MWDRTRSVRARRFTGWSVRIQAAFSPIAAIDLPYWSASGKSDADGTFPLAQAVDIYAYNSANQQWQLVPV